jgi:hypothetical protein
MFEISVGRKGSGFIGATVVIDRSSPFGNPFPMKKANGGRDRQEVVEAAMKVARDSSIHLASGFSFSDREAFLLGFHSLAGQAKLGDVMLACHCAPELCHGDVLKSAISWYVANPDAL